jgi:hypothetical protein
MAAIVLLTLGALNAVLALTVETCTQGDAGSLDGGYLTLALYLAAAGSAVAWPPRRRHLPALVPAALVAAWQSHFAVQFLIGYWFHGMSACFAMHGGSTPADAGEWMDGDEARLTVLWGVISLLFWLTVALAFWSMARVSRRHCRERASGGWRACCAGGGCGGVPLR